jgi:hypothetical protein
LAIASGATPIGSAGRAPDKKGNFEEEFDKKRRRKTKKKKKIRDYDRL